MKFPKTSQECIHSVDATPNDGYPLRILRAYRENCNCRWEVSGNLSEGEKKLWELMNKAQEERVKILDRAIAVLERELKSCAGSPIG